MGTCSFVQDSETKPAKPAFQGFNFYIIIIKNPIYPPRKTPVFIHTLSLLLWVPIYLRLYDRIHTNSFPPLRPHQSFPKTDPTQKQTHYHSERNGYHFSISKPISPEPTPIPNETDPIPNETDTANGKNCERNGIKREKNSFEFNAKSDKFNSVSFASEKSVSFAFSSSFFPFRSHGSFFSRTVRFIAGTLSP